MAYDLGTAVFLDYHGVLTDLSEPALLGLPDCGLLSSAVIASLRELRDHLIFVVSNQVGVARGDFTESALRTAIARFRSDLRSAGIPLKDFLYCPHLPNAAIPEYRQSCQCRKPGVLLVSAALAETRVPPGRAVLIGDSIDADVACALAAGITPILIAHGHAVSGLGPSVRVAASFPDAVRVVTSEIAPTWAARPPATCPPS